MHQDDFGPVDLVLAPGTASGYKRVKKVNAKTYQACRTVAGKQRHVGRPTDRLRRWGRGFKRFCRFVPTLSRRDRLVRQQPAGRRGGINRRHYHRLSGLMILLCLRTSKHRTPKSKSRLPSSKRLPSLFFGNPMVFHVYPRAHTCALRDTG